MTRLTTAMLLSNATRRALVGRVMHEPGLSVGTLATGLGVDYKTALYHARVLERAGHLIVERDGGRSACYHCATPPPRRLTPWAIAVLAVLRGGAASPTSLSRALGWPRSTTYRMLVRLEARGLARRAGDGWVLAPGVGECIGPDEGFSRGPT